MQHARVHAGELAYWVSFDEPEFDSGGSGPCRQAMVRGRYPRLEPASEE
ncbi:hypothetical protein ACF1BU_04820 [Streptomyces sp. NPDC014724]